MFIVICDGGGRGEGGTVRLMVCAIVKVMKVMVMCTDGYDGSVTASEDFGGVEVSME